MSNILTVAERFMHDNDTLFFTEEACKKWKITGVE